jgi:NADH:ubiquinone oxidoreductase subunit H
MAADLNLNVSVYRDKQFVIIIGLDFYFIAVLANTTRTPFYLQEAKYINMI